jgi:antitoxin PrlF
MIQSRITSKAQTTIPRAVRAALGVDAGDQLIWEVEGNRVVVSRVESQEDGFVNNFSAFTEWADDLDSVYDNL